jgi:cytochrome c5
MLALVCATASSEETYPEFPGEQMQLGRTVWLDTCKVCHMSDFAGAPLVTDRAAWAQRLQQGKDVLYQHAIEGFHGPMGTEMPPRGGNAQLTDEQVRAAVDYMVALVSQGA